MRKFEPDCMCGDALDEHDDDLACIVKDCTCFYYEADEEE